MQSLVQYLKNPEWRRQHRWRRAIWSGMTRMGLTGMHLLPLNRRWIEIHRRKMPMHRLDKVFHGMKIVQISDLHFSPVVWRRYLEQHVHWVNELEPDLVVVTGDLITGGYSYANRVARILNKIQSAYGVLCTFGNHDYSMFGKHQPIEGRRRADHLERVLVDEGLIVLRNQAMHMRMPGAKRPLVLVGLDDEWSGQIDPKRAWSDVDAGDPIICLNHNPANCLELMPYAWQWMLSGHTHGRAIATSKLGKRLFGKRFRHFTHGYYSVNGRHLYVNRGLSYGQRSKHWCRPEITVFKLAGPEADATDEEVVTDPRSLSNGN
jgi:uncharacterized protein